MSIKLNPAVALCCWSDLIGSVFGRLSFFLIYELKPPPSPELDLASSGFFTSFRPRPKSWERITFELSDDDLNSLSSFLGKF